MGLDSLLDELSSPIDDVDEETFLLFSQDRPDAQNLGFVDPHASSLTLPLGGHTEVTVTQSPGLLHSSLSTGTTGAVLWRVSPLVASWMLEPDNLLFVNKVLHPGSAVLELGCGISGVMALALAPRICTYICTDQQYVLKQLRQNIAENVETASRRGHKGSRKVKRGREVGSKPSPSTQSIASESIRVLELDWETTSLETLSTALGSAGGQLDMVIACDCIYNSHLVEPLTQTCVEICRSRAESPVVCLVAQQLRSEEVFQEWLHAFLREFTVWRIPDKVLSPALRASEGYVLHLGVLRSSNIHS